MEQGSVNTAILERLEKVVQSLQDNSVKMGHLLAVHNEKLDKQDQVDRVLFEKVDRYMQTSTEKQKQLKEDVNVTSVRVTIDSVPWRRRCGLYLVLFLLYLSSLVQSDKKSLNS